MKNKLCIIVIVLASFLPVGARPRTELRQATKNLSGRSIIVSFGESDGQVINCSNFQKVGDVIIFVYNDGRLRNKFGFYSKGTVFITLNGREIVAKFKKGVAIGFEQNNGQLLSLNVRKD